MSNQFCPMCGEEELLVRWAARDLDPSEKHLDGRAWACDACGAEETFGGFLSVEELLVADRGQHVLSVDLAVVAKAVQKYLQSHNAKGVPTATPSGEKEKSLDTT